MIVQTNICPACVTVTMAAFPGAHARDYTVPPPTIPPDKWTSDLYPPPPQALRKVTMWA
jgi:hypothetical protein